MASGTPSSLVRIPEGDILFFDPALLLTRYYRAKSYPAASNLCGGRIIIRRRNNYPGRERVSQEIGKKSQIAENCRTVAKIVSQCQKYPIPYPNTLRDHSISLYISKNTILIQYRPFLIH